ncbi:uncharacterized protein LOC126833331 [Adelges cooleyi]|uniref:uncharacterized protein LOC126833331 n=1 Tax=Adelges cooleyi TaxID=133065 RepID=UPI00218068FD|nr:uncharacterized protein LOC126833331 [Adelges cooleyi]
MMSLMFFIFSIVTLIVSQTVTPTYLGCYRDDNLVSLGEESRVLSSISPKSCTGFCHGNSYLFAAIKNDTCYCSKSYISRLMKQYDKECTISCAGEPWASCGAFPNLISSYLTDNSKNGNFISRGGYPTAIYLGCYAENANDPENRLLKGPAQPYNNNTPQKCSEICFKMGYVYAGVTYGSECWCGNQRPSKSSMVENSNCNVPCSGDSRQFCGGGWKTGVYSTGMTQYVATKYEGCFADEPVKHKNGILTFQMGTNNSPKRCMNLCNIERYKYALLKGNVCECRHNEVNYSLKRDHGACNTVCLENPSDYCGGQNVLSVYKTLYDENTGLVHAKPHGCFKNPRRHPTMDGWRINDRSLTVRQCVRSCYARRFPYAALVSSTECMCSFTKPSDEAKTDSDDECNTPCSGDATAKCGGKNVIDVYSTGLKWPTTEVGNYYLGCYEETAENRIFNGFSRSYMVNTPAFCTKLCYKMGFGYAGVTYKSECFCGSHSPNTVRFTKVEDSQCNTKCSGDANQYCGGGWRMGVFATGLKDFDVLNRKVGCYTTQSDVMNDVKFELINTNTPGRCARLCHDAGFRYAGISKFNCFCDNEIPSNENEVDYSECSVVCSGDDTQTCGDSDRLQIYDLRDSLLVDESTPGSILVQEEFDTLNLESLWNHEIYLANDYEPNFEFVIYNNSDKNIYIKNGELFIRPTLLPDNTVKRGSVTLKGCTKPEVTGVCTENASTYNILPPVVSAKLTTRNSFLFIYGKVEVTANLPSGDWIVPEIALVSKSNEQLKIVLASTTGNANLRCGSNDESSFVLKYGIQFDDTNRSVKSKLSKAISPKSWSVGFHTFVLTWTQTSMEYEIDGEKWPIDISEVPLEVINESEFYVSIGLSVGGMTRFPDGCLSNGHLKPWKNFDTKALVNFHRDKNHWEPTWSPDKSILRVQSVKITSWARHN